MINDQQRKLNTTSLTNFKNTFDLRKTPQEVLHREASALTTAHKSRFLISFEPRYLTLKIFLDSFELFTAWDLIVIQVLTSLYFSATTLVGNLTTKFEFKTLNAMP